MPLITAMLRRFRWIKDAFHIWLATQERGHSDSCVNCRLGSACAVRAGLSYVYTADQILSRFQPFVVFGLKRGQILRFTIPLHSAYVYPADQILSLFHKSFGFLYPLHPAYFTQLTKF